MWLFVVLKLFVYVMSLLLDRLLKGRRHSPPPLFLQYLGHNRRTQWHPTPVFLPGESQGWGSLVGCRLWGRTELDTTEAT